MPESNLTIRNADCYAAGERQGMQWGQQLRAILLRRLLVGLEASHVSPNGLTFFSCLAGLAAAALWLGGMPAAGLAALTVHVLLDGLDGPLARFQETASPRGSFVDTCADQLVVTAVTIAWILGNPTGWHVAMGALFVFLYALVVAMAMVRNALGVPFSWLVRPRFFIYSALAAELYFSSPTTLVALALGNSLLAIHSISGFAAIHGQLPGPTAGLGCDNHENQVGTSPFT